MGMKSDRDTQCRLVGIIRRLDEALELLDQMDHGDGDGAAFIQRAVNRAKRELRSNFGRYAAPLPPHRANRQAPQLSGRSSPRSGRSSDMGDLA
ncbi:hypothetical protein PX699_27160 [Sphingobium sp. H39-3-25]|uniref:hypothetical protein n=1 Tax=Sphingobium arseniciresistens TaxID=3030834 RepID=UPI0023B977D1|nr:hypothetical protein [Sphingobium arseniciresistens]